MKVSHRLGVGSAVFDDDRLVSCAGLVPVMTLAEQTGLSRLIAEKVCIAEPPIASGAANPARSWLPWWLACARAWTVSTTLTWSAVVE